MLKLLNLKKDYVMKDLEPVHALKGISVSFRRNEFVAILGPSGCGKTTLLNIVGGLDRYTDGELFIEGKSTKQYKDGDWDTYRNHSIGFVFQSYNLISHSNILSNVELALTISGIDKKERRQRAIEVLEKVGLKGMEKKKPNQLSGGQMQRVAIARALINNPEILLADEPTGALDSETSIQIMDLLKEVAKDRLVIMVTHNPDLAEKYATRIISMKDGLMVNDTKPYEGESEKEREKVHEEKRKVYESKGKKEKTSMSFFTATGLSFSNLLSKLKRTILIAIAGSIGIIGISSVLAVSFGVTGYVKSMQDDMLSSYPISIAEESVDYSSLMTGLSNAGGKSLPKFDISSQVGMDSMISYLMEKYTDVTNVKTNDINKELVQYIDEMPNEYYSAKKKSYGIDVTNNIFCNTKKDDTSDNEVVSLNGLTQRYIAELKTVKGFSSYASYVDLFTNFMKEMPDNGDYILGQYDLLGNSKMAENANEIMLVVDKNTTLTDLVLAQMGYYKHDEFINIAQRAIKDNEAKKAYDNGEITKEEYEQRLKDNETKYPYRRVFEYTDLIGSEFYYFPSETLWNYGQVSKDITYSGTVLLVKNDRIFYLSSVKVGTYELLTGYSIDLTSAQEPKEVFYTRMGTPSKVKENYFDGSWIGIDTSSMSPDGTAFRINDVSGTKQAIYIPDTKSPTTFEAFTKCLVDVKENGDVWGFNYPAVAKDEWISDMSTYKGEKFKVTGILRAKPETKFGSLTRGVYYTKALDEKYCKDADSVNSKIINDSTHGFKTFYNSYEVSEKVFPAYVTYSYYDHSGETPILKEGGYSYALNGGASNAVSSLFSSMSGNVDLTNQNQVYLRAVSGLKAKEGELSYTFERLPEQIQIYPKDFTNKDKVTAYLDVWNSNVAITLKDGTTILRSARKDVTYNDTVKIIITVINTLISAVTTALIAFTSLSLVVSCFMIAVITYISTMERVKEIGIIRSLGGRKKDVSRLFIAECLIIGLTSGAFGVVITYIISIILNLISTPFGISTIASLPIWVALIMVALSIVLNVLSGLIPSMRASKQDPVLALRSE